VRQTVPLDEIERELADESAAAPEPDEMSAPLQFAADANAWAEDLTGLGADYLFSLNRHLFLAVK